MSACPLCEGSGFEIVRKDEREFARRCACRRTPHGASAGFVEDCRIPPRYAEASFESFHDKPNLIRAVEVCKRYCERYPSLDPQDEGTGLLLMGNSGAGKTHLAVSVLRRLYAKGAVGQFWDFRDLMREIRRSYDPETRTTEFVVLQPVVDATVLLLDDLGSAKFSDWMSDTLFHILNRRYLEKRPTLVTTNYFDKDPEAILREYRPQRGEDYSEPNKTPYLRFREFLVERIGMPLRSRLMEMCHVITIQEEDYREGLQRERAKASWF